MTRQIGYMDWDLFTKIIDEVAAYSEPIRSKEIELFHFGESLFHRRICEMIAYASKRSLNIVLSVNAPQLTKELGLEIIKSNPAKTIISLDGYDTESYREIRGMAADYETAVENIECFLSHKKSIAPDSQVILRMIRIKRNESHTDRFIRIWKDKGAQVEIRPFFPWSEKEMVSLGSYNKLPPFMPCGFPWQHLVVQWNGDIVPCCRDYNGRLVLGNVRNISLKDLWNSIDYEKLREQHRTGEYKDNYLCEDCMDIYFDDGQM